MASNYFRPVLLLTAILSLAQSIAWFVLSLLGILAFRCDLNTPTAEDGKFVQLLYYLYFQGTDCPLPTSPIANLPTSVHIRDFLFADPLYINGWMAAYLALSITYFLISICLLVGLCRSVNGAYSSSTIRLWCFNTLAFLIMDFWLTIVWGLEYKYITDFNTLYEPTLKDSFGWGPSVPGMLMAVTARGFVLYVINFALFCYLVRYAFNWSIICNRNCCQPVQTGSQQQLNSFPSDPHLINAMHSYDNTIPRAHHDWDSQRRGEPIRDSRFSTAQRHEGVTSFDSRTPPRPSRNPIYDDRPKRSRDDEFVGRPSVRSNFEYPDKKNFQRGRAKDDSYF